MTPISPFLYCQCICYVSPISNLELAFKAIVSQCQECSPTWVNKYSNSTCPELNPANSVTPTVHPSKGPSSGSHLRLLAIFSPHPWLVIWLILTSNTHLFYHHCYNFRSDARLLYSSPLFPLDWNSCLKFHLASFFCPLCYEKIKFTTYLILLLFLIMALQSPVGCTHFMEHESICWELRRKYCFSFFLILFCLTLFCRCL